MLLPKAKPPRLLSAWVDSLRESFASAIQSPLYISSLPPFLCLLDIKLVSIAGFSVS
jgi:hypothetical protein